MASEKPTDAILPNADRPDPPNAAEPAAEAKLAPDQEAVLFKHFKGYLFTERNGELKSWVWDLGVDIQSKNDRKWVCLPCLREKKPKIASYGYKGTQNMENHLWKIHGTWDPSGKRSAPSNNKGGQREFASIADFFSMNRNTAADQAIANKMIQSFDTKRFQQLMVNWIVDSNLPFSAAENPRLRAVLDYLSPQIRIRNGHISHHTVRSIAIRSYHIYKRRVVEVLRAVPGKVHVAFDGARSRNRHSLYGITAAYLDQQQHMQKITLGCPQLGKRHTGENIAAEIKEVIKAFQLEEKLGYFTLDNATNNDAAMADLGSEFGFDPLQRRVRCFGHIINLVVKALLFGSDDEAFDDAVESDELLTRELHDKWMKKGPVGKIHNWVVWVHRSDLLTNLLKEVLLLL